MKHSPFPLIHQFQTIDLYDYYFQASSVDEESNALGWAPLRDTYMLGSKLKDWDKMAVSSFFTILFMSL